MNETDKVRKWRLLLQEIEDRAAMFKAVPHTHKASFFEATSEEITELGVALGLDPNECRQKLEQVFARSSQADQ